MKTFSPRPRDIERRWFVVDADGAVLGRLASEVAKVLRGKHKPIFAPHMDTGDYVIVINARRIRLTGGKETEKRYHRHSGFPGGLRSVEYTRLLSDRPAVAVEKAVRGMLPKNRLGRQMFGKLSVYEGSDHPHQAQRPVPLGLGEIPRWEGLPAPKPKLEPVRKAPPAKAAANRRTRPAAVAKRSTARRAPAKAATATKPAKRVKRAAATKGETASAKGGSAAGSGESEESEKTGRVSRRPRRSRTKKES